MSKELKYTAVVIISIFVVLLFITSKSYIQLFVAIATYPVVVYLILKVFPRVAYEHIEELKPSDQTAGIVALKTEDVREKVDIADIDKRTLLKFIGTAGASFFIFSLLGRRAEDYIFNKTQNFASNPSLNVPSFNQPTQTNAQPPDEYKISEIDDNGVVSYYGFLNKSGGWMVMRENTQENSFRYSKGDSGFSINWGGRADLKYDYYHNLF